MKIYNLKGGPVFGGLTVEKTLLLFVYLQPQTCIKAP